MESRKSFLWGSEVYQAKRASFPLCSVSSRSFFLGANDPPQLFLEQPRSLAVYLPGPVSVNTECGHWKGPQRLPNSACCVKTGH